MSEEKLRQAQLFLNFYFAPWGAAKGEVWEDVTHDRRFSNESALEILKRITTGEIVFTKEDIAAMNIVVS